MSSVSSSSSWPRWQWEWPIALPTIPLCLHPWSDWGHRCMLGFPRCQRCTAFRPLLPAVGGGGTRLDSAKCLKATFVPHGHFSLRTEGLSSPVDFACIIVGLRISCGLLLCALLWAAVFVLRVDLWRAIVRSREAPAHALRRSVRCLFVTVKYVVDLTLPSGHAEAVRNV
eukprot:2867634-Prymnesium_polylepis.1